MWDINSETLVKVFKGHLSSVISIKFSPNGNGLFTAAIEDGMVRVWDIFGKQKNDRIYAHLGEVTSVEYAPKGEYILTGGGDGTAVLWRAETHERVQVYERHSLPIVSVAISPDEKYIATADNYNTIIVWDLQTGEKQQIIKAPVNTLTSISISPDSTSILSSSDEGVVNLWDIKSGKEIRSYSDAALDGIDRAIFSPNGVYILAIGYSEDLDNSGAILWNTATGMLETKYNYDDIGFGQDVDFMPDGKSFIAATTTLSMHDTETGKEILAYTDILDWDGEYIRDISITPDGKEVIAITYKEVRIWDIKSGALTRRFSIHDGPIYSVAISPDQKYAATASGDGTFWVWEIDIEDAHTRACSKVIRPDLNDDERKFFGIEITAPTCPKYEPTAQ